MTRLKLVQTPYADNMLQHPLFRRDASQVTWIPSPQHFWGRSLRVLLFAHLMVFAGWAVILALRTLTYRGGLTPRQVIDYDSQSIVSLLVLVLVPVDAVLDFICLQAALKTISGEVLAGRWDLLRLTALSERGIVRAKHAGVQLRVWRSAILLAGLRAAAITLALFVELIWPYLASGENSSVGVMLDGLAADPLGSLMVLVITAFSALIYVIEPFWRMRAMTALGMVLSAYIMNVPLAMLAAVGTMFGLWLVQVIVAVVLFFSLGAGLGVLVAPLLFATESALPILFYVLLTSVIIAVTIWGFYALLQAWSLRRVLSRIDKTN